MNRNRNPQASGTATSARRALPAITVVALALGLAACQTPVEGHVAPQGHVVVPAVVDGERPSDRIAEQMERQALQAQADARAHAMAKRFQGVPADRVAEQLAREAQIEHEKTSVTLTMPERFKGMTADRIADQLVREAIAGRAHRE